MKIVEIKNSLAKLYYEPSEFPLVLSDFLTIDDENQKILSQVVSIESTSKESTNCAILKFSLDIKENNVFSSYSGYTPALDAKVTKTSAEILKSIFSSSVKSINVGTLTSSSNIDLNVNASILDNFLYIQSDREENTDSLISKILDFNFNNNIKTVAVDFSGITEYKNAEIVELGKNFKLPIGNETLNYIYENDLTGLTVEQKTIVQDIILEIQDYINTLEAGFIPFNTLLDVVNDIYESDKSTGIILLRNKLLKYKQINIFASSEEEINTLDASIQNNPVTVLNVSNINLNWQKEALDFALNNIKHNYFLVFKAPDEVIDKKTINKIYKSQNIKPVIASKYEYENAQLLKSFAKNLILFKPEEQQRAFATYNSFLMKLVQNEFIVSGEATFYTPLIVKEAAKSFEVITAPVCEKEIIKETEAVTIENNTVEEAVELLPADEETNVGLEPLEEDNIELLQEDTDESELKNIFEESLEQEIAKDVDQMFYAATSEESLESTVEESLEEETSVESDIVYEDIFSDDDLDMLDSLNSEESGTVSDEPYEMRGKVNQEESFDTDLPELDSSDMLEEFSPVEELEEMKPASQEDVLQNLTENESLPSIPIYKTELDTKVQTSESIKIAEGNIVYHEKYGRGVVEELFNYGKRTLCSIQFDNVGRRLLDPNLAELKQM